MKKITIELDEDCSLKYDALCAMLHYEKIFDDIGCGGDARNIIQNIKTDIINAVEYNIRHANKTHHSFKEAGLCNTKKLASILRAIYEDRK